MLDLGITPEKVQIMGPLLDAAIASKEQLWPAFDGTMLDRTQFVSSSEVGKCAREIWFSKHLPPIQGKFKWGFAERGHGHEAWVVQKLHSLEAEYMFNYMGEAQRSFYDGKQSGTPDGIWKLPSAWWLWEHKSIDPRTKVSALPKPAHIAQVIQNMDLVEACLDIDIEGSLLVYSNASDFSLTYEFWIDRNSPKVGEAMIILEERAGMIMNATRAEDVPAEGLYTGGCKMCPYGSQCSAAVVASKQEKNRYDEITNRSATVFGQPKAAD